jgi:hypothetical protein
MVKEEDKMGIMSYFKTRNERKKLQQLKEEIEIFLKEYGIYKDTSTLPKDEPEYWDLGDLDINKIHQMMKDGQVKAGITMYQLGCTAKGFIINARTEQTKKYADFIYENFAQMEGTIEGCIREILTAIAYGFSCTEKVFYQHEDGTIRLQKLKPLDPLTVRPVVDKYGNIKYVIQELGSEKIKIPANKVIWYAFDKKFGNVFGQTALEPAHKHWYIKNVIYCYANIAYERYGSPLLYGRVNDARDVPKMLKMLKNINGQTALAFSGQDEIGAIQSQPADFTSYIEHHDRKILESLLIPPLLLSLSKGQGGSYALSGSQYDVFVMRLASLQREIADLINEHIVKPLININFPNVTDYPVFMFKPMDEEDREKMARVIDTMIRNRVISPSEDWIRQEMGFPEPTEDERKKLEQIRGVNSADQTNQGTVEGEEIKKKSLTSTENSI